MKSTLNSNKIISFIGITYIFSWAVWFSGIALNSNAMIEDIWIYLLVGSFSPTVAAIIMLYIEDGFKGIKQLFTSVFRFKFHVKYWLVSLFMLPVIWSIVFFLIGKEAAEPDLTGLAYITILIAPINGFMGIFTGIGPIGEEIGWRGYLLGKMLKKLSLLKTNLLLGLVWAFWHLPLIIKFPEFRSGIDIGTYLVLYAIMAVAITSFMTNVWKRTSGSVFIAIWVHSLINDLLAYSENTIWLSDYSKTTLFMIICFILVIASALSFFIFANKKIVKAGNNVYKK
jgi:membrane protease YdiL (CAAX protease family)